jgi:hypothetical protein
MDTAMKTVIAGMTGEVLVEKMRTAAAEVFLITGEMNAEVSQFVDLIPLIEGAWEISGHAEVANQWLATMPDTPDSELESSLPESLLRGEFIYRKAEDLIGALAVLRDWLKEPEASDKITGVIDYLNDFWNMGRTLAS